MTALPLPHPPHPRRIGEQPPRERIGRHRLDLVRRRQRVPQRRPQLVLGGMLVPDQTGDVVAADIGTALQQALNSGGRL